MSLRFHRVVFQGSGVSLAALIAVSMSLPNQRALSSGNRGSIPAVNATSAASLDRHALQPGLMTVSYNQDCLHHFP